MTNHLDDGIHVLVSPPGRQANSDMLVIDEQWLTTEGRAKRVVAGSGRVAFWD
jgi:hypothetical protein